MNSIIKKLEYLRQIYIHLPVVEGYHKVYLLKKDSFFKITAGISSIETKDAVIVLDFLAKEDIDMAYLDNTLDRKIKLQVMEDALNIRYAKSLIDVKEVESIITKVNNVSILEKKGNNSTLTALKKINSNLTVIKGGFNE